MKLFIKILLLFISNLLYAEGFTADTLVHTQDGLRAIENIHIDEYIHFGSNHRSQSYIVVDHKIQNADHYIEIEFADIILRVAYDQRLYTINKGWVQVDKLELSEEDSVADTMIYEDCPRGE